MLQSIFVNKVHKIGSLFLTAVNAASVAKALIIGILFSVSVILAF